MYAHMCVCAPGGAGGVLPAGVDEVEVTHRRETRIISHDRALGSRTALLPYSCGPSIYGVSAQKHERKISLDGAGGERRIIIRHDASVYRRKRTDRGCNRDVFLMRVLLDTLKGRTYREEIIAAAGRLRKVA